MVRETHRSEKLFKNSEPDNPAAVFFGRNLRRAADSVKICLSYVSAQRCHPDKA